MDIVKNGFTSIKTLTVTNFLKVNSINREQFSQPNNPWWEQWWLIGSDTRLYTYSLGFEASRLPSLQWTANP
jgi:hypothetical protein